MGGRGSASGRVKYPTSYRGPGEYGREFARLNPKMSPEKAASMAVDAYLQKEDYMTSDGDINGIYEDVYKILARKRGDSALEINNALNEALRTKDVVYEKF